MSGKTPIECLKVFRNLMVDVVVSTSYGYRLGAVHKWSLNTEDPLSTAIHDFPIRGILVRLQYFFFIVISFLDSGALYQPGRGILSVGSPTLACAWYATRTKLWLRSVLRNHGIIR